MILKTVRSIYLISLDVKFTSENLGQQLQNFGFKSKADILIWDWKKHYIYKKTKNIYKRMEQIRKKVFNSFCSSVREKRHIYGVFHKE